MSAQNHTLDDQCSLSTRSKNTAPSRKRRDIESSPIPPPLKARFFFSSNLPIDDPLSPIPQPSTATGSIPHPPRPFSLNDDHALEAAWLGIHSPESRSPTRRPSWASLRSLNALSPPPGVESADPSSLDDTANEANTQRRLLRTKSIDPVTAEEVLREINNNGTPARNSPQLSTRHELDPGSMNKSTGRVIERDRLPARKSFLQVEDDSPYSRSIEEQTPRVTKENSPTAKRVSIAARRARDQEMRSVDGMDDDDSRDRRTEESFPAGPCVEARNDPTGQAASPALRRSSLNSSWPASVEPGIKGTKEVPVGISRLHLVSLPALQMKPIYWSPVNDVSSVVRGTWFYKNSMYPVESYIANLLEIGYAYMKPWSREYTDEINSCLHHGADAELKLTHPLWPKELLEETLKAPSQFKSQLGAARVDSRSQGASMPEPEDTKIADRVRSFFVKTKRSTPRSTLPDTRSDSTKTSKPSHKTSPRLTPHQDFGYRAARRYASYCENMAAGNFNFRGRSKSAKPFYWDYKVMYANEKDAQILRPNQLPAPASPYKLTRERRPLGDIYRGKSVGIPVVRGFDSDLWDKLYPTERSKGVTQAQASAKASRSGTAAIQKVPAGCPACAWEENQRKVNERKENERKINERKVNDLILVIHGIGQKRSESDESFNFTHSVNSLRRQVYVELGNNAVRVGLRKDLKGIMVLPVNWRSTVSLDDDHDDKLNHITVPSIPAIRKLISDVLLDIPYYFSAEQKPKMIAAVVTEANRVYRLWCANNPDFAATGRVHLIAHSLGSVMAVDILSNQPTQLPATVDLTSNTIPDGVFEFDTKSLFLCGSPTGLFLLLNQASLIPRKGRRKPGSDPNDTLSMEHEGEAGTWGCMAVDNVYNIMHKYDPIAYRLNACVSLSYSDSLLPATIPSLSTGWLQSLSSSIGLGGATNAAHPMGNLDKSPHRPANRKLPSTVELEVHQFREESIAENKMYRLNDNGQIDFYLSSGNGPLEIQYWTMLGAHSSYWGLREFTRFIVAEVGRGFGM